MEPYTHSFIVKIWLEETAEETGKATWRGHITHVPSGKRRYIKDLDEIWIFMTPYLERMGVMLPKFGRLQQRLEKLRMWFGRKL